MKRDGYLFDKLYEFSTLYQAFRRAIKGAGKTEEACRFCFYLEKELVYLRDSLAAETYCPAPYRYFQVHDPKERTISVARFRDRVVHHAVVAVLESIFERTFIYDSYATRKGKGSHRAVRRSQEFLQENTWYLKLDIEKYFDNIDHRILLDLIGRKIKDAKLLRLIERIVANSDVSRGHAAGKGLPIGNLTSQFFANIYLDALDHFVKERLRVKAYVRYMDDMVFFAAARDYLKELRRKIETFLTNHLKLKLKTKATLINTRLHGLPFLGYRVFPRLLRIKRENLQRIRRRMKWRVEEFRRGLIPEEKLVMSMGSWFAFIHFADTQRLCMADIASRADVG